MTKKDKKKALKEAFSQALEIINFYKSKSLEELENMDTSELCCLGAFFNWLPQSGYDYDQEQTAEEVAYLCERADYRARKEKNKMTNSELLQRRFKSLIEFRAKGQTKSLKEWEILIEDTIEDCLTEEMKKVAPCWWQHTTIQDLFIRLMGCQVNEDLCDLIEEIAQSLHE